MIKKKTEKKKEEKEKKFTKKLKANWDLFKQKYINNLWNISKSCRDIGKSPRWFYTIISDFPQLKGEFDNLQFENEEGQIDLVEEQLFKKINKGDTTAIIFFLKTKWRSRGYIERKEIGLDTKVDHWEELKEFLKMK